MADLGDVSAACVGRGVRSTDAWTPTFDGAIGSRHSLRVIASASFNTNLTGGADIELGADVPLALLYEFGVIDRKGPVGGVVRFFGAVDGVYFAHSFAHDMAWRVVVTGGVAEVTPLLAPSYPTIPLGSRLLVIADGKIKAITPT